MDDSIFKLQVGADHYVCMSPMTKEDLRGLDADGLGDDFGYFVYEAEGRGSSREITLLAKCPSMEAADRLVQLYGLAAHVSAC